MSQVNSKLQKIPKGYKQSDVGVVPENWCVKKIGSFAEVSSGGTPNRENKDYWGGDIPWVTTTLINGNEITSAEQFITQKGLASSATKWFKKGTVLMAMYGQGKTRGKASVLGFDATINQACAAIVVQKSINSDFFLHYLNSQYENIRELSNSGGQENLSGSIIKAIKIPIPELKEQTAIASALSDVDALITSLEKLIEKKRAIKAASMQQLLTGKKRLPGFCGGWITISMSKDADLKARIGWQALTTNEYLEEGKFYLVTGTDFKNGRVNWITCHYVDEWRYSQDRNIQLKNGDVLLTKDGTIGKVGFVNKLNGPATLNSGVFVIRPIKNAFDSKYLFYILSSRIFDDFLNKITAGSTITHLYQKDFVTFEFEAPMLEEQIEIADALSSMDDELEKLDERLNKTQQLKQGMMQELLTGRTRLI